MPNQDNTALVAVPCVVFLVLCPLVVCLRFWARVRGNRGLKGLGADDWTILGSLIFASAVSILMLASCGFGFGKHVTSLTKRNKLMALKLFWVAQAFYKININMTKASILLLYLRIFVQKPFRICCWVLIAIISMYGTASTIASFFQCDPIPRAWNKAIPGHCINITKNWYGNAGFSIITDILILALPMPMVYKLSLPAPERLALAMVFALGGFVVITSFLRMTTLNLSTTSLDITYDIASSMWTIIESSIGIICACLPMCRVPFTVLPSPIVSFIQGKSQHPVSSTVLSETQSGKHLENWPSP